VATKIWTGAKDSNWGDADNWNPNGVPGSDDVYLIDNDVDITAGLDQSLVTLASLTIDATYTGLIGTKTSYLQVDPNNCYIGRSDGVGSPIGSRQIKLDFGAVAACETIIYSSANLSNEANVPPIRILADHASHCFEIKAGRVGFAVSSPLESGESMAQLIVGFVGDRGSGPEVIVGAGMTVTTEVLNSGTLRHYGGAITTATVYGGALIIDMTGNVTNLDVYGGHVSANDFGTITTVSARGGLVDFLKSESQRTVTNMDFYRGGSIQWSEGSGRFTVGGARIQETLELIGKAL